MAVTRAFAMLLLVCFLLAAIAPASMADDDHEVQSQPNRAQPCKQCYGDCIQTWRDHTCHVKCLWCLPLNETISGAPPSDGWQSAIQTTRDGVGAVVGVVNGAIEGTKNLLHLVF